MGNEEEQTKKKKHINPASRSPYTHTLCYTRATVCKHTCWFSSQFHSVPSADCSSRWPAHAWWSNPICCRRRSSRATAAPTTATWRRMMRSRSASDPMRPPQQRRPQRPRRRIRSSNNSSSCCNLCNSNSSSRCHRNRLAARGRFVVRDARNSDRDWTPYRRSSQQMQPQQHHQNYPQRTCPTK